MLGNHNNEFSCMKQIRIELYFECRHVRIEYALKSTLSVDMYEANTH